FQTSIKKEAASEVARRSRGTPRIANRLLKRIRDISQVKGETAISLETTDISLSMLQVDDVGLDHIDQKLLKGIIEDFQGGPVGLDTIAATMVKNHRPLKMYMNHIYCKLDLSSAHQEEEL